MDLVVSPGPGLPDGLVVPGGLLAERFSRSPGPGGQSVNTSDSRVEVDLELALLETLLAPAQQRRLRANLASAYAVGRLTVTAHDHRSQHRNRVAARERLAAVIRAALAPPPPARKRTKPTRGSQERRLQAKRERAQTKADRARPGASGRHTVE